MTAGDIRYDPLQLTILDVCRAVAASSQLTNVLRAF